MSSKPVWTFFFVSSYNINTLLLETPYCVIVFSPVFPLAFVMSFLYFSAGWNAACPSKPISNSPSSELLLSKVPEFCSLCCLLCTLFILLSGCQVGLILYHPHQLLTRSQIHTPASAFPEEQSISHLFSSLLLLSTGRRALNLVSHPQN